jgi:hypothetical protein
MISHGNPEIRKDIEERLVRSYYQEQISKGDRNIRGKLLEDMRDGFGY